MLALYIVAAIVGGGLILLSALGGLSSHADLDHSADVDHPGDVDHPLELAKDVAHAHGAGHETVSVKDSGELWLPFFSARFWTYLIGTFGIIGTLLTIFRATAEPMTAIVSIGSGLLMGLFAAYTVRYLTNKDAGNSIGQDDFLGTLGRLTVPARGANPGKVRVSIKGDIIDMIAVSDSGGDLEAGEEVLVVGVEGNQVRVARKDEYLGN